MVWSYNDFLLNISLIHPRCTSYSQTMSLYMHLLVCTLCSFSCEGCHVRPTGTVVYHGEDESIVIFFQWTKIEGYFL